MFASTPLCRQFDKTLIIAKVAASLLTGVSTREGQPPDNGRQRQRVRRRSSGPRAAPAGTAEVAAGLGLRPPYGARRTARSWQRSTRRRARPPVHRCELVGTATSSPRRGTSDAVRLVSAWQGRCRCQGPGCGPRSADDRAVNVRSRQAGDAEIAGVVLAGGRGTRLSPRTDVTNKHLLPVGREPMVVRAIRQLVAADVQDVLLVIDECHASEFMAALRGGRELGLRSLVYVWQPACGRGMPSAIGMVEHALRAEKLIVACGDVLIDANIADVLTAFRRQRRGARMVGVWTADTAGFSRLVVRDGLVTEILDKDRDRHVPGLVDLGFYLYHHDVFDLIRQLKPSARGETEIWELNRAYAARGQLPLSEVSGWWADVGESLDAYDRVQDRYLT